MSHDFLTRIYFRHYAFLMRRYPGRPPSAIFHYATFGISALLSAWLLAIVAVSFWLASQVFGRPIAPWDGPNWLIVSGSLGLVFLPGLYVDRKFRALLRVDFSLIEAFSTPNERFRWWLAALSTVPSAAIVAGCFGAIRLSG